MIRPDDFAMLSNLDEAPDGLYKLVKFAFNTDGGIRLCFRNEGGQYAELGVNDTHHISKIIQTPQPSKIKIA